MERSLRRLLVSMPLLASVGAQAMSVGEIEVASHLGEPLKAMVPVSLDGDTLPGNQCARLVGPARHHPDLAEARVELEHKGSRYVVAIDTDKPVGDPVLDLSLLFEGCGPTIRKDFVILLSPRNMETAPPTATPVPPRVSQAPVAQPSAGVPTRPSVKPDAKPAAKPITKPAAKPVVAKPPRQQRTASRYVLRLDYDHGAFGQLAARIAERRQAEYLAANKAPRLGTVGTAPEAQDRLSTPQPGGKLEAPTTAPAPGNRLMLQPPPDDLMPNLPGAAETPGRGSAGGSLPGSGKGVGMDGAPAMAPASATYADRWYGWLVDHYNLILPLLLVLVALAVALWLKLRRPQSRFLEQSAPDLHSIFPAELEESLQHPLMAKSLPTADEVFIEPAEAQNLLNEALENGLHNEAIVARPRDRSLEAIDIGAKPAHGLEFAVEQHDSFDQVMELAEVMLAFGRSSEAITALSQHIRDNPRLSLDPWLKLLDLYYQSNLRNEFEALAADLHKHYNVAIIEWAEFAASPASIPQSGPLTLESLPHIMSRLTECWGTRDCLGYLDKVLADNRGGQRLGFSMPIVRDILLLRDILRQTCAVSAKSL